MKSKLLILFAITCLGFTLGLSLQAGEEGGMAITPVPRLIQVTGTTTAGYRPVYYPSFYKSSTDNPACANYLRDTLSGETLDTHTNASVCGASGSKAHLMGPVGPVDLTGLYKEVAIPAEYRRTSKLLITWTVRIEGYKVAPYLVWTGSSSTRLCHPWHGTSYQSFDGGKVWTALYVSSDGEDWSQAGEKFVMTIPSAGSTSIHQPSDPTQTGSYLLTKDFEYFDGALPERVYLKVVWKNETCMRLESPANMRSLIINLLPLGGDQDE